MAQRKDLLPELEKLKITRKIFELLKIPEDPDDFSEKTPSGGGSTVTKNALAKIYKQLSQLKENGALKN